MSLPIRQPQVILLSDLINFRAKKIYPILCHEGKKTIRFSTDSSTKNFILQDIRLLL